MTPPLAKRIPTTHTIHNDTRTDDYRWLQDKTDPEVITYLNAENAYTKAALADTESLQESLYNEMLGRIQETDLSVPYPMGEWLYFSRTEEGKQYPIHCRKPLSGGGDEQVILDVNVLAEGQKFMSVGALTVSDDGNLLAYTTDNTGFRQYRLSVKDLRSGDLLPDTAERVGAVVWAADNQTLFYSTEDETTKRDDHLWRKKLGETPAVVFHEPDALYRVWCSRSRDKKLIFMISAASTSSEWRWIPADAPQSEPTLVLEREAEHEYDCDHRDGLLYLRTNKGAINFKLVATPLDDADPQHWSEVIPGQDDVMVEDFDLFENHLVASLRVEGLEVLRVLSFADGQSHDITFPEPTYSASGEVNRVFETSKFRFAYASLVTPRSIFEYDLNSRERVLLKETPVLGGYDREQYVSERLFATASDGTRIPISLVRKRSTPVDGTAPCLLYGYGSYGISIPAGFSSHRLSLLDRGFAFAIAHIRGGGELGKPWHDAGKMMVKKNTFTDFIACADFLVSQKHVDRDKLAIMGGSAGGLLMGAVVNLRPDVAKACISVVPFVDVINTMLDDTLPLTVGEYLEWGNPNEPEAYAYMKSYSPYDQLEARSYPAMLVRTSLNDSQVMYWEPAKYVAKLRTLKTDDNPLLFHCNMDAGHGGASGRYDALKETALDYAFLIDQLITDD
jgi:oligopeptidase B